MATDQTRSFVNEEWDNSVIPVLSEYIRIPNVSPIFDAEWQTNGLIEKAAKLLMNWAKAREVKGMHIEVQNWFDLVV